jgi:phosphatidylglycerophosphate synthase
MIQAVYKLLFMIVCLYGLIFGFRIYLQKKYKKDDQDPERNKKRLLYLVFIFLSYLFLAVVLSNTFNKAF